MPRGGGGGGFEDNGSCSDGVFGFWVWLSFSQFHGFLCLCPIIIFSLSFSQLVKGERVRAILSYNQDYELKLFTNSSKVCVINDTQYFNTSLS